jgi:hypothetical protein
MRYHSGSVEEVVFGDPRARPRADGWNDPGGDYHPFSFVAIHLCPACDAPDPAAATTILIDLDTAFRRSSRHSVSHGANLACGVCSHPGRPNSQKRGTENRDAGESGVHGAPYAGPSRSACASGDFESNTNAHLFLGLLSRPSLLLALARRLLHLLQLPPNIRAVLQSLHGSQFLPLDGE